MSSLNFGKVIAGSHTSVKVLDFAFSGVSLVSNVKLGIMSSTLDVNDSPQDVQDDGSASNGRFGIMHTDAFDKSIAGGNVGRHFAGRNESGLAVDPNNVLIGTKSATVSQFVYLDIELGGNDLGTSSGTYKVFFDFE